jgi:hypothetical protein
VRLVLVRLAEDAAGAFILGSLALVVHGLWFFPAS